MIPKKLHYCWFGNNKMPALALKCLESWQKHFPGWQFILWNESNSPLNIPYLQNACENKKWANASNFIRLHALKEFGGVYLDTDVEVIKAFDFLNDYTCFAGFENDKPGNDLSINNAVIGATANHSFINLCYTRLLLEYDGTEEAYFSSPVITTNLLKEKGLTENAEQDVEDVHVFSREKFHPFDWDDVFTFSCIQPGTYAIHYWNLSWKDAKGELINLYSEKQKLISNLKNAENTVFNFTNGRIKMRALLKTNISFLKNFLKKRLQ